MGRTTIILAGFKSAEGQAPLSIGRPGAAASELDGPDLTFALK